MLFSQADSAAWAPGNPAILPVTDEGAMALLNLSARILKLARTIADLAEALQHRPKLILG